MAVATLGKSDKFNPNKEEWLQYVEHLGHFFTPNNTDSAEEQAVFLAVIGPATYRLLYN